MGMKCEMTEIRCRQRTAHYRAVLKPQHLSAFEPGFTLIELMVSLLIGMVLMAGIYTNFIMQSRVQTMQSDITDNMGDLYLASTIMLSQLRTSTAIDTTTANEIAYDDVNGDAGIFRYTPSSGTICWDIPNNGTGCQELMRNLDTSSGLSFTPADTGTDKLYTVTLNSTYTDNKGDTQTLGFSFKVWPRN